MVAHYAVAILIFPADIIRRGIDIEADKIARSDKTVFELSVVRVRRYAPFLYVVNLPQSALNLRYRHTLRYDIVHAGPRKMDGTIELSVVVDLAFRIVEVAEYAALTGT
jgi:hypothetical protein